MGLWCIAIGKIGADFDVYWEEISIRFHLAWKIGPCYKLCSILCSRQAYRPSHLSNIMLFGLEHTPWFGTLCLNRWSGLFVDKINNAFLYILVRSSFHNFFPLWYLKPKLCVLSKRERERVWNCWVWATQNNSAGIVANTKDFEKLLDMKSVSFECF